MSYKDDSTSKFYEGLPDFSTENLALYENSEKPFFSFRLTETSVVHVRPIGDFERPCGHNYDHLALLVDDSVEDLKRRFVDAEVDIKRESEPLGATGVAPALYVNGPFGYLIEIKETA